MAADEENPLRLPGRETIDAYVSDGGFVCLRQEQGMEAPAIVAMLPTDIPTIVRWLQQLAREAEEVQAGRDG